MACITLKSQKFGKAKESSGQKNLFLIIQLCQLKEACRHNIGNKKCEVKNPRNMLI
jgi:hypothetical protein